MESDGMTGAANLERQASEPGHLGVCDTEITVDMVRLRGYRLSRVQEQLRARDYAGCLLVDPINVRYATGSRNMAVWCLHNPARYCFVPAEGTAVMFEFDNCEHLSRDLETIGEVRPAVAWFYFFAGSRMAELVERWADEVAELVRRFGGENRRLALDYVNPAGTEALQRRGIELHDGLEVLEQARSVKSPEEIACMTLAVSVCEAGFAGMREALKPGMTENQVWSILHQTNIAMGGEWIETRLLTSGPRTNPWFQESSDRVIRAGELVVFDSDMVGPLGYMADISRAFHCGPGKPTLEQRELYKLAHEQVHYNLELLRPGLTFAEFSEQAWKVPTRFAKNRYGAVAHGVGLCDEYPLIGPPDLATGPNYDGRFEENMTLCVESYIGAKNGHEGVKLEQQVLITASGAQLLSTFPFEEALLA